MYQLDFPKETLIVFRFVRKSLETGYTPYSDFPAETGRGCSVNWLGHHIYHDQTSKKFVPEYRLMQQSRSTLCFMDQAIAYATDALGLNWMSVYGRTLPVWSDSVGREGCLAGWDRIIATLEKEIGALAPQESCGDLVLDPEVRNGRNIATWNDTAGRTAEEAIDLLETVVSEYV